MKLGKIRPTATIVAQFAAGIETDAISHDGRIYLPISTVPTFVEAEDDEEDPEPAAPKKTAPKKETKEAPAAKVKQYTEDEMMDMESKELEKILKKEYGINPDDYEGKNTNKKLRKLILEAQEKAADGGAEEDPNEGEDDDDNDTKKKPAKKESKESDDLASKIADLLEDFDAGKRNKKKTIKAICDLVEDADTDKVTEIVDQFESDTDVDLDEIAENIAAVLNGEEPEEEEDEDEKPAKKSPKKGGKKDEKLVAVEDLEVGDRVSVYWDDDNKDWFDGEVKSIKKGKVTIAYDDDTEDVIDPEVHTKIRRI